MEKTLSGILEALEEEIEECRKMSEDEPAFEDVIEGLEMAITIIRKRL
jgi:hypothetical protein